MSEEREARMTEHLMAQSRPTIVLVTGVVAAWVAEKVMARGPQLALVFAVALVAPGIWLAVSPASVPGLTEPGGSPSMEMGL
jgi:hypothetical protein